MYTKITEFRVNLPNHLLIHLFGLSIYGYVHRYISVESPFFLIQLQFLHQTSEGSKFLTSMTQELKKFLLRILVYITSDPMSILLYIFFYHILIESSHVNVPTFNDTEKQVINSQKLVIHEFFFIIIVIYKKYL